MQPANSVNAFHRLKRVGAELSYLCKNYFPSIAEVTYKVHLWIQNLGNCEDNIHIEVITDMDYIEVIPEQDTVGMTSGASRRFHITIVAKDGACGSGLVTIKATTNNPGINSVDQVDFTLTVREKEEEAVSRMMIYTLVLILFGLLLLSIIGLITRIKRGKSKQQNK